MTAIESDDGSTPALVPLLSPLPSEPKNILKPLQSTSLSDDESYVHKHSQHISHMLDEQKQDSENEEYTPLVLRNSHSAGMNANHKRRKQRSNSAMISPSSKRNSQKYKSLKRKFTNQESQLQLYAKKITHIQDESEETEAALKREYELKLMHLETKYLKEREEKSSLQNEIERLRQELTLRRETSIGYSSPTIKSPQTSYSHQSQIQNQFQNQFQYQRQYSTNSSNTVVINESNVNSENECVNNENMYGLGIIRSRSDNSYLSPRGSRDKRAMSSVSNHSTHNSSESSSVNSNGTDSMSENSQSSENSTYSEPDTESTYVSDDRVINMQKPKRKYKHQRSSHKHKNKYEKKHKKIPQKYRKRKGKKEESTNGFWSNLWSMFGPANVMCSTCSDKR